MAPLLTGAISIVLLIVLALLGVPIYAALSIIGIGGMFFVSGVKTTLGIVSTLPFAVLASYSLAVIPLFYLMGEVVAEGDIARGAYSAAQKWLGGVRGGLLMATTVGSGISGAAIGSSVANSALFTRMAYPEMRRFNYDKGLALGTISSAGTFASMIPPSIGLVLYGIVTEEGIGQLLMAGILPGCITILAYMAVIWFVCWRNPRLAPRVETKYTLQEKLKGSLDIWGIMVLFILIMGGIYTGLFPPTVGAAIGAFGAFVLAISTRKLNTGAKLRNLALSTVKGVSSLTIILVGGFLFARFLVLSGFVEDLVGLVTIGGIPPVAVIGLICLMYIVLGCAMDPMSMLVCTMPFIYPLVIALGYDGIWFGIIYTKVSEIGCVTPPVGMNLYVVAAAAGDDVSVIDVAKGIVPFIFADLAVLIMLIAFPGIPLLIPNKMFQNG